MTEAVALLNIFQITLLHSTKIKLWLELLLFTVKAAAAAVYCQLASMETKQEIDFV